MAHFCSTILWRRYPFAEPIPFLGDGVTQEEADMECLLAAKQAGWKPPARWQWWRKRDHRTPIATIAFFEWPRKPKDLT
jgi:hypothetical protein